MFKVSKEKFKIIVTQWSVLFIALCVMLIIFVELFVKTNIWIFIAVVLLFFIQFRLSHRLVQHEQSTLIRIHSLSTSSNILAEAVKIQSNKLEDMRQFLLSLIKPKTKMNELTVH